VLSSVLR
jgi:hypothetical protein